MSGAAYRPATVPAILAQRVAASPTAIAFQFESSPSVWNSITWFDFAQRVERLRCGLVTAGLRPGDRLAIIAPVSLEWELLHHAALALGAVVVGLDSHDVPARLANMIEQADVTAVATTNPGILVRLNEERWARVRLAVQLTGPAATWPSTVVPMPLSALEASCALPQSADVLPPRPGDLATIIFTSGTTGLPKGIAYRQDQLCLAIASICDAFPFVGPDSRLLCWLPLSNLFQRIVNLACMHQGAATYLLGDPVRVMAVVGGVAPDVFIGVPRFYEKLYDGIRDHIAAEHWWRRRLIEWAWQTGRNSSPYRQTHARMPLQLRLAWAVADRTVLRRVRSIMGHRLRCMVTGSAPTSRHLLEELHALGWLVLEAYGLSENVVPMAMNLPNDFRFGSVGKPVPCNDIRIDGDGNISVRGFGVCGGYLGASGNRGEKPTGFHATGDLGSLDRDGFLTLVGRKDDLLKTSTGRRVAPVAIEAGLAQIRGVEQAVVIGHGRKLLVALCSTSSGTSIDTKERARIEQELLTRLTHFGQTNRPSGVLMLAEPFSIASEELTPNLKPRRAAIEARHQAAIDALYADLDSQRPETFVVHWAPALPSRAVGSGTAEHR